VDGGDIQSVKFTSKKLNCVTPIKDNTCICHRLNNIIKMMVGDYLEEHYLNDWRTFIKRIHKSNPFSEEWDRCCNLLYNEKKSLQIDTPTRWSSTVRMLQKSISVKDAVLTMHSQFSAKKEEEKV
jgi:5'-deoxynucleotidase YfbR-like HD superfamily hydrolase